MREIIKPSQIDCSLNCGVGAVANCCTGAAEPK